MHGDQLAERPLIGPGDRERTLAGLWSILVVVVLLIFSSVSPVAAEETQSESRETVTIMVAGGDINCVLRTHVSGFTTTPGGPGGVSGFGDSQCDSDVQHMEVDASILYNGIEESAGHDECDLLTEHRCRLVNASLTLACQTCTGSWETVADIMIDFPAAVVVVRYDPQRCEANLNSVICHLQSGAIQLT